MTKVAHTPGSWSQNLVRVQRQIIDRQGRPVAYTHGQNIDQVEDEANARLIAAAPELLDVVQCILAEDMICYMPEEYVARVRAAVDKAVGGIDGTK